jgi:AcrR family transcriptional regulator
MSNRDYKADRKKKLLGQATQCLARNPNASLTEIAEHAGVGIATLHRYFPSKSEMLHAISCQALDLAEEAIAKVDFSEPDIRLFLRDITTKLVPLGDRMYFLAADVFNTYDEEFNKREKNIAQRFMDKFKEGQVNNQLRKDLKVEWMYDMMYSTIFLIWKYVYEGKIAAQDAPDFVVSTLLGGFRNH